MTTVGDILEVTLHQVQDGEALANVWQCQLETAPTAANETNIANRFEFALLEVGSYVVLQHTGLSYTSIVVRNLTDGIGFAEITSTNLGTNGAAPLPNNNAIGVRLQRTSGVTRNGHKRMGGITEDHITGNDITPASKALWQTRMNTLFSDLTDAGLGVDVTDFTLDLLIIGRKLDGTYDLTKLNSVANLVVTKLSHQDTRLPRVRN